MSGYDGATTGDNNGNNEVHIIADDTQAVTLAALNTQAQEVTLQNVEVSSDSIDDTLRNFKSENNDNLIDVINSMGSIGSVLKNIDTWSNSVEGAISPFSSAQESESSTNIKSIRIKYSGSQTIYFQIHNKIFITPFSNSTMVGMGYKLAPGLSDLVISYEAALQCLNGIAWAISSTQLTYTASLEEAYVFMQFMS